MLHLGHAYLSLVGLHMLLRGRHRRVGHPGRRPRPSHRCRHAHGRPLQLQMKDISISAISKELNFPIVIGLTGGLM